MRRVGWVIVASALLPAAACTTDGQGGAVSESSAQVGTGTPPSVVATDPTGPTGTGDPAGAVATVVDARAELDRRFGPELALRWQPMVLAPCGASPFSVLDLDSHVMSASADAQLEPSVLDAVLGRIGAGGRTIPSVDGHTVVVGDGWEALVAIDPTASDAAATLEVTVDVVVAVQSEPRPDDVELQVGCDAPTRPSYQTTGSALGD